MFTYCLLFYSGLKNNVPLTVRFYEDHSLIIITPKEFTIPPNANENWTQVISFYGDKVGRAEVLGNATPTDIVNDSNLFVRIIVANSSTIVLISFIVGWVYFVAWSVSFYPQIRINFMRKSVVGLNFDFLALNLLGHTLYAIFNSSLYWITYIEEEYFERFPRGLNPVELNDVVFSIHASVITAVTVAQCFIYEVMKEKILPLYILSLKSTKLLARRSTSFKHRPRHHRYLFHCYHCDTHCRCSRRLALARFPQHLQLH
jgi:hypothetical protein